MQRPIQLSMIACTTLLAATFCFGFGSARAGGSTYIDGGKTFMLGGEQSAALSVEGRNGGPVPVEVLLMSKGQEQHIATVAPGKSFALDIPARRTTLFRNGSKRTAVLKFELTQDVGALSMRYDKD